MPAEACASSLRRSYPQQRQQFAIRNPLEQMHFTISQSVSNVQQEKVRGYGNYTGEDKEFGGKWEPLTEEKKKSLTSPLEEVESSNHHHQSSSVLHHNIPDEGSLDSQDRPEGSITPTASTGSASSPCPEPTKEATSFLYVGPLGKKRKYNRQRATSDDNESESHPQTAAGSPETLEEEMDQAQSPSPGENSQSSMGRQAPGSSAQEHSPFSGGEPVSTITRVSASQQSASPESGGESGGEGRTTTATIISKPSPIIGAPTSVIRRTYRKKQEHPLNLSVSSPPSHSPFLSSLSQSSTFPSSSTGSSARLTGNRGGDGLGCTTNPSVIREELFFDGRPPGDRQVFIWRYRDDALTQSPLSAGPMSPTSSTVSATNFIVPDVTGTKMGSSASSSASSSVSQLQHGSHDPMTQEEETPDAATGATSGAGGKPPKKKLRCGDCGKEFSQLRNYRYHRSRHEGSDQFSCTCPVCGKQFNDRGYLSSHMKIHRNAKEYRCEYCTKGFNQRVAYNMHRRIHTGHRPHQCEVCGKSFSRRMLLKQHMRIHTGERPYSCGVCNKAFADRSNMLLHQRLHSGERPYVCEICKKSFSKNHHLKTHMNHHAGIKPYECPKCHARFSQSSNMKTHFKKCSGVPNPSASQRQQMLRRNPLDIGRHTAHLPNLPLPGVVAAAAAVSTTGREPLPSLPGTSRLLYEQQSLNFMSQSMNSSQQSAVPQLSPGHPRGQVPIESLLLHLNVGRSRHPSQGSIHSAPPTSPTSTMSFPDLQLMLRNAAASGSRSVTGLASSGQRSFSNPSSPGSSSTTPTSTVTTSGMHTTGMGYGGIALSPNSVVTNVRRSPIQGNINCSANDATSPPALSSLMSVNPTLGLVGYGAGSRSVVGNIDCSVMPPPPANGTVLRNIPSTSSIIPAELLSPTSASILRVDTRSVDSFPSLLSPSEKGGRQGRVVPSPMISPRRKQPSPSSLSGGGSFIPLSTLESAAIASGLRSPSQVVRFLSSALRDAESPLQHTNQYSSSRLPSLSHQNMLEAMVAAAAAEQNVQNAVVSTSAPSATRIRQIPSPQYHQQQSHPSFQFSGELPSLPSLHMTQGLSASHHSTLASAQPHQQGTGSHNSPPFSVITSSHLLQQQDQQLSVQHPGLSNVRHLSSSSPSSTSTSRLSAIDEHHAGQPQQIELQHPRQHGYHQSLLLSHVNQGTVLPGYSSTNNNSGYSAFTSHSIIRSRSHSPDPEQLRDRNPDFQN